MYDSHSHLYSRQYFHSQTCLPVTHAQLDYDSDDDVDEGWIVQNDEKLLDEFDDVSAKEKTLMKLWNRHVRSYKIYADHSDGICSGGYLSSSLLDDGSTSAGPCPILIADAPSNAPMPAPALDEAAAFVLASNTACSS